MNSGTHKPLKLLFLGDIVGRSGREAVLARLPEIKQRLEPDIIIINAENAAGGFGTTVKIGRELLAAGAHVLTNGNHVWDQKEFLSAIDSEPRWLRPINLPSSNPGRGFYIHQLADGRRIMVVNALGRVFMDLYDDPFAALDALLEQHKLGQNLAAIFVDFHADATSEKMAMAHYLDGRVSAVVGTHTHCPSADAQIFNGGTAYQSDAGMCGDYNSVIGFSPVVPIVKFTKGLNVDKKSSAEGEATVCGVWVEVGQNGLATRIAPLRIGPRLIEVWP